MGGTQSSKFWPGMQRAPLAPAFAGLEPPKPSAESRGQWYDDPP
jgi:hypothetical protein